MARSDPRLTSTAVVRVAQCADNSWMLRPLHFRSILMACCGFAAAASAQSESRQEFVCTRDAETRLVSVHGDTEGRGCRVDYTRAGVTKMLWSAKSGRRYCAQKAIELVTSLTDGQFQCMPHTVEQPGEEVPADPARND